MRRLLQSAIRSLEIANEEQKAIPHHLLDIAEPSEPFGLGEFCTAAETACREILSRGRVPVLAVPEPPRLM